MYDAVTTYVQESQFQCTLSSKSVLESLMRLTAIKMAECNEMQQKIVNDINFVDKLNI